MCLGLWLIKTEREIGYCDRIKPAVNFHMAKCDISFIGLLEVWQTKGVITVKFTAMLIRVICLMIG